MKSSKVLITLLTTTVILFLLFILVCGKGMIGVHQSKLEADARKSQQIDESWLGIEDISDKMAVLLFYDEAINDHVFSIYLNKDDFSFGYKFREGGSLLGSKKEIQGISYQGVGMALLSLNGKEITEIKIDEGSKIQTIEVDFSKPFVAVIPPSDNGSVTLYNTNGESIPIDNIYVY